MDDVLYTGRTIRAAIQALLNFGRPKRIWLSPLRYEPTKLTNVINPWTAKDTTTAIIIANIIGNIILTVNVITYIYYNRISAYYIA